MKLKYGLILNNLERIYCVLPNGLRAKIIIVLVNMTLAGILELGAIMSLTGFFMAFNSPDAILASGAARWLTTRFPYLDELLADRRIFVLIACLLPISVIFLKNIITSFVAWQSAILTEKVASHIGTNIMDLFLNMPYSWHMSAQSSEALTAMQWRFSLGQMLLQLLQSISNFITVSILFMAMFFYAPYVTLSTVFFMFIVSTGTYFLLRKKVDESSKSSAEASQGENSATMTAMGGVREIIIYQKQKIFLKKISDYISAGIRPRSFLNISASAPTWILETFGFFLVWIVIFLMIFIQNASLPEITTTVALFTLTAWRVLPAMNRLVGATVSLRGLQSQSLPCLDYFEKLAASEPVKYIEPDRRFTLIEDIEFKGVSFVYPNSDVQALNDINCVIPHGSAIGLIGRSGAGKSTFINLICGLIPPTGGEILVNGQIPTAAEWAAYRLKIGYVPQQPYLIGGTVAQNIAFSDWGETIDEDRVKSACKAAAIDFLEADYSGIEKNVSPSGFGFSGGQMQRITIARALYTNPSLIIFDEATSALDDLSEEMIQEQLIANKGRRTCIIAAHRLSTLEFCDRIIWLEKGRISAYGETREVLKAYGERIHTER